MTVDVHGHVTSPELLARFPMPPALGDVQGMIERKAAAGVTMTVVGSPVGAGTMLPVPGMDAWDQPADRVEAFHDWLGETVRSHPDHLRGYVWVDPLGGEAGLDRAARRLAQEEFVGLIANTSVRGRYLDSPRAEAFFAMAAEAGVPVLLHPPADPPAGRPLGHLGLVEHVARPCDVTVGVAAILVAGWLERHPGLVLVAATAGGALPLLREKLELAGRRGPGPAAGPPGPAGDGRSPAASLGRLYLDTATPSRLALTAALETVSPGRLLFGTDSPPMSTPLEDALRLVEELPLSDEDRQLVLGGTARRLFGLPPGAGGTGERAA